METIEPNRLPTFIIGGAPRSGTTFLCHILDKHPDVFIAKPFSPEPKVCLKPNPEGTEGYRQQYKKLFAMAGTEKKALGEKSSAYFENIYALNQLRDVFCGNMRFLFIVRDPIKRAYSNYVRSCNNGLETLSFAQAIALEGKRQDPFPPDRSYVRPFDYLTRGNYATFAERYIAAFGPENIKFVLFEDIQNSPDRFYFNIQSFIQVEPLPRSKLEMPPVNASDKMGFLPLELSFENMLREKLRPEMERFAILSGLDIGAWGY